jgi:hypothetical protein
VAEDWQNDMNGLSLKAHDSCSSGLGQCRLNAGQTQFTLQSCFDHIKGVQKEYCRNPSCPSRNHVLPGKERSSKHQQFGNFNCLQIFVCSYQFSAACGSQFPM